MVTPEGLTGVLVGRQLLHFGARLRGGEAGLSEAISISQLGRQRTKQVAVGGSCLVDEVHWQRHGRHCLCPRQLHEHKARVHTWPM